MSALPADVETYNINYLINISGAVAVPWPPVQNACQRQSAHALESYNFLEVSNEWSCVRVKSGGQMKPSQHRILLLMVSLHSPQNIAEDSHGCDYIRALIQHHALRALTHRCIRDLRTRQNAILRKPAPERERETGRIWHSEELELLSLP
jgi:hypothetical protein